MLLLLCHTDDEWDKDTGMTHESPPFLLFPPKKIKEAMRAKAT
jgi:hypothetical protein